MAHQNTSCRLSGFIRKHGSDFMKTLFILSNASGYGGAEKSIEILVGELVKSYKITICVENDHHYKLLQQLNENLDIICMYKRNSIVPIIKNLRLIHSLIIETSPSILLANSNKGAFYLSIISYLKKINHPKTFLYVRDFQWKYTKFIFRKLNKATYLIPTPAVLDKNNYLRDRVKDFQIKITGNPVPLTNKRIKKNQQRHIVCLANIAKWKGIEYLLKAYDRSKVHEKGIKLIICGKIEDQKYHDELMGLIHDKEVFQNIEFKPFINQVEHLYQQAMFVVNTSISEYGGPETFGRTIIEAWAYKKPVIAFNVGGPKYLIDDGINGFLVPEKDIAILSERIKELSADEQLRIKLGSNGYEKNLQEFSTELIIEKLINEFEK